MSFPQSDPIMAIIDALMQQYGLSWGEAEGVFEAAVARRNAGRVREVLTATRVTREEGGAN